MIAARFASLALATLALSVVASGCAASSTEDDEDAIADTGDGVSSEQDLISEHNIVGSELPDKTIALTFDDGPGPRTVELTEYLAAKGLPATFFINGKNVPGRQGAVDAIVNRGFTLANHTQNHLQLPKLSSDRVVSELQTTDAIIGRYQPNGPFLFRAPFGAMSGNVIRALNGSSMKKYSGSIFWDVGGALTANAGADWDCWGKGVSVQRCGELYLSEIRRKRKGIVLMHDIHNKTTDMVKNVVVPALLAEGWRFAKLTDVPAIQRSLGAAAAPAPAPANNMCSSATLGRAVNQDCCVQSRGDQKWHLCMGGEWVAIESGADRRCTGDKFPLQ